MADTLLQTKQNTKIDVVPWNSNNKKNINIHIKIHIIIE